MLAHLTGASESGLWPTPTCGGGGQTLPEGTTPQGKTPEGRKQTVCLERYVHEVRRGNWPTPRANDAQKRGDFDENNPRNGLAGAVKKWPTPRATDGTKGGPNQRGSKGDLMLASAVHKFPTPTVQDAKNNAAPSQTRRNSDPLNVVAGGRLNPQWVEWLMGWPIGWTDLQPLATDRFREWLAQHGGF